MYKKPKKIKERLRCPETALKRIKDRENREKLRGWKGNG